MIRFRKIPRRLEFDVVQPVFFNQTGNHIGDIVKWRGGYAYHTWRKNIPGEVSHFMRKYSGFGIDKTLFWKQLVTNGKYRITTIIIEYYGPEGLRYFLSSLDPWFFSGKEDEFATDDDRGMVTHAPQIFLAKTDFDDEWEVDL
jgi:hypothetical protein